MTDMPGIGTVSRLSERALDAAVGGASMALDAVRDPQATVEEAERRGSRVNARLASEAEATIDEAASLPEKVLFSGLRALRSRARRSDVSGAAARRLLLMVHRPAGDAARVFERIERETTPPSPAGRRGRRSAATGSTGTRGRATATAPRRTATAAPATRGPRRSATGSRATTRGRRTA
jgi:hypothetical protein